MMFLALMLTFTKLVQILKQINKLLFEVRIYFKNSGIFYEPRKNNIIRSDTCQYCIHRMSYINITGSTENDDFYYKCRRRNIDILLSDSCDQFERDFNIK